MDPIISHLLAGLGGAALGVLVTWLVLRRGRAEGANAEKRLHEYRHEVAEHFARTAELVDNMTDSYKAVFDELKEGANRLMEPEDMKNLLADRSDKVITLSRLSYRDSVADSKTEADKAPEPDENQRQDKGDSETGSAESADPTSDQAAGPSAEQTPDGESPSPADASAVEEPEKSAASEPDPGEQQKPATG